MKRRTTDYYFRMKQDDRVRFLEGSVQWMRTEAMKLMKALEKARNANTKMRKELDKVKTEKNYMLEYNICEKRKNLVLKKTVDQLKDPENIRRYFEASQKNTIREENEEPMSGKVQ